MSAHSPAGDESHSCLCLIRLIMRSKLLASAPLDAAIPPTQFYLCSSVFLPRVRFLPLSSYFSCRHDRLMSPLRRLLLPLAPGVAAGQQSFRAALIGPNLPSRPHRLYHESPLLTLLKGVFALCPSLTCMSRVIAPPIRFALHSKCTVPTFSELSRSLLFVSIFVSLAFLFSFPTRWVFLILLSW